MMKQEGVGVVLTKVTDEDLNDAVKDDYGVKYSKDGKRLLCAIFETTDDRLTFLVTIPIHEGCNESSETSDNS